MRIEVDHIKVPATNDPAVKAPCCITIQTKFVDISSLDLEELGFDWLLETPFPTADMTEPRGSSSSATTPEAESEGGDKSDSETEERPR